MHANDSSESNKCACGLLLKLRKQKASIVRGSFLFDPGALLYVHQQLWNFENFVTHEACGDLCAIRVLLFM